MCGAPCRAPRMALATVWGISGHPMAARHRHEITALLSSNLQIKILIRSLAISGKRLVRPDPGEPRSAPDCSQSRLGGDPTDLFFPPPPWSAWSGLSALGSKRLSECLAFLIPTQNYFETILRIQFHIRNISTHVSRL